MSNNTALVRVRKKPWGSRLRAGVSNLFGFLAVMALLAYAVIGPSGLIALSDHKAALGQRKSELAELNEQHDRLANRVQLLDPNNIDPDLGGELIRKELGVAAPDEIVIPLD